MTNKKLMVGSIFFEGKNGYIAPNDKWIELQRHFLNKTSPEYDHVVGVCGKLDLDLFKSSIVLGNSGITIQDYKNQLRVMLDFFKSNSKKYEAFLLLDSDAFPIMDGWFDILTKFMKSKNKWYSSPLRIENLDFWPHLSCFFILSEYIDFDIIDFTGKKYNNIYGEESIEFGAGNKSVIDDKHIWLPLLRSNIWNPHPIISAVYSHVFYHHGAGSRHKVFRGDESLLFDERIQLNDEQLQKKLFDNPERFIGRLLGKFNYY